ncbi:MAG: hypothetical protein AAF434_05550 [Pseudomonadota bacterium]
MLFLKNELVDRTMSDAAFRDPFSETTNRIRTKLLVVAPLTILTYHYPIDASESHIIGLKFTTDSPPAIIGLLGIVTAFYAINLLIFVYQEFEAWRAQTNFLEFEEKYTVIKQANERLDMISTSSNLGALSESLGKSKEFLKHVSPVDPYAAFAEEVSQAKSYNEATQQKFEMAQILYTKALRYQIVKTFFFGFVVPFSLASWSIFLVRDEIVSIVFFILGVEIST